MGVASVGSPRLTLPPAALNALWCLSSFLLALRMARRGLRKQSLNKSGAAAAVVVGTVHMGCGLQFGLTLISFYLTSSKLTRVGAALKAELEEGSKEGGQRTAQQVLANSLLACCYALAARLLLVESAAAALGVPARTLSAMVAGAFLGHYACCCGDTWASEVGILSRQEPRLITCGRRVPRGTNGGVSLLGLAASAAGGLTMGLAFWAAGLLACAEPSMPGSQALGSMCRAGGMEEGTLWQRGDVNHLVSDHVQDGAPLQLLVAVAWRTLWESGLVPMLLVGLSCGVAGSLVDSVLGATLQYSGWDPESKRAVSVPRPGLKHVSGFHLLSNDAVNGIAAAFTAVFGAWLLLQTTRVQ